VIGGFAPVFYRDDMVDFMFGERESLGNTAVFAEASGARPHQRPQNRVWFRHYPQKTRALPARLLLLIRLDLQCQILRKSQSDRFHLPRV
jgi:hypothetical protein